MLPHHSGWKWSQNHPDHHWRQRWNAELTEEVALAGRPGLAGHLGVDWQRGAYQLEYICAWIYNLGNNNLLIAEWPFAIKTRSIHIIIWIISLIFLTNYLPFRTKEPYLFGYYLRKVTAVAKSLLQSVQSFLPLGRTVNCLTGLDPGGRHSWLNKIEMKLRD